MKTKTNRTLRKILSIALCLALVMSYVPMVGVTAKALSDGVTDASIYDGDRDGRYEIGSSEQLTVFANLVNGGNTTLNVELVSDVVFDGETPWVPIGSIYDPFEGIFDGQFYTISGLYINDTTMKDVGLFGTIAASGRVKNVGVINSKFITTRRGDGYSAGGVAVLNRGRIEQCYVENTTIQANGAGGIVSVNQGYINNCYTDATIKGNFAGGIAESNFGCIYASIGTSSVTGDTLRGSLVATNYERNAESTGSGYSLISSYGVSGDAFGKFYGSKDDVSGAVSSSKMASGEIAYDLQSCSSAWGQALGVDEHPVFGAPKVYYSQSANSYSNYEPAVCNDSGIYEIAKAENFMWFAEQMNKGNLGSSVNAILTDDIDLTGYSWKPIGNASTKYKGVFDGQGHTISNFNMTITGAGNWGLFGYATGEGTVIKNFSISGDVTTALTSNVDVQYGVVGQADGTAKIRNVHSSVNLTSNDTYQKKYFGGIVGRTGNITVDSCSFRGKLSLDSNTLDCVGGIVGYVYNGKTAKINNCGFYGNIESTYSGGNVGGVLGYYNGENAKALTISNCLSVGTLPEGRGAIVGTLKNYGSTNAGSNNYYLDGVTNSVTNVTAAVATQTQLASGEIAIALGDAWGQMSNTEGSLPIITDNELYKVVTVGETGNYSVANVGDTNGDGTIDVEDYQVLVNKALADDHEQIETASYDDIVKYDLDGDGYLDVIDAYLLHLFINGFTTVDVYAVGDYDLNGVAFEEADILAMAEAMGNPETLATHEKYACDLNADGKVSYDDLNTLTSMFPLYFVGEE